MQTQFNQQLLSVIGQLPRLPATPRFVVALSGGVDSVVLLKLLVQFQLQYPAYQIIAHNVNHGLSPHANQWAEFCHSLCHSLGVKLLSSKVTIEKKSRNSLEALAREARYQCFSEQMIDNDIILTGHHQDDQLETLLLALKRGSGSTGLQGIRHHQIFFSGYLVRPLLHFSRQQITDYAQVHELSWVEDESNQDTQFDRNFIRHQIAPLLLARWPAMAKSVSRTAQLCQEQQRLMDEVATEDFEQCLAMKLGVETLSISALIRLSDSRRYNLLRYWVKSRGLDYPSSKQLSVLWKEVALAEKDKQPCLKLMGYSIQRYIDNLYIVPNQHIELPNEPVIWNGEPLLWLSEGSLAIDFSCIDTALSQQHTITCSFRKHLDSKLMCLPEGRHKSRSIKKLLHEFQVPPWQREQVVFIFIDGQLVQAVGVWHCQLTPNRKLPKLQLTLCSS